MMPLPLLDGSGVWRSEVSGSWWTILGSGMKETLPSKAGMPSLCALMISPEPLAATLEGAKLIRTQEFQTRSRAEGALYRLIHIVPTRIVAEIRVLSKRDIIFLELFIYKGSRIELERLKMIEGFGTREFRNQNGVAMRDVPEIMQTTIG